MLPIFKKCVFGLLLLSLVACEHAADSAAANAPTERQNNHNPAHNPDQPIKPDALRAQIVAAKELKSKTIYQKASQSRRDDFDAKLAAAEKALGENIGSAITQAATKLQTATQLLDGAASWDDDLRACPDVKVNVPLDIKPYLQSPTTNSIWVSWKTKSGTESLVEYGKSPCDLKQQSNGSNQSLAGDYQYHSVQLQGLEENQRYYYRVKTGSQVSGIYRFKTPKSAADKDGFLRILVFGDHQIVGDNRYLMMVEAAKKKLESVYGKPLEQYIDLVINDGDQVDYGNLDQYENLHFAQSAPVAGNIAYMTTVGNHEYFGDPQLANYRAHFIYDGLSYRDIPSASDETYYAYQIGRGLMVHLNSMSRGEDSKRQTVWLKQIINAAKDDASVDWIISIIHHPYRAEQYTTDVSADLQQNWMPILAATPKHVLNIAGHHHNYARGQVTDHAIYHMISGGAAWNQYWGQVGSTERNLDDVQKTITNWAWQVIEIDLHNRSMTVNSYAETHPLLYEKLKKFTYNSRLIDTFTRRFGEPKPTTPSIVDLSAEEDVDLSRAYTFKSSAYHTIGTAKLNTSHFQLASNAAFTENLFEKMRHYEDIFGDTGAPDYIPIDLNKDVDILKWRLKPTQVPNGHYFVRVRHRDRNMEWSQWSAPVAINIINSRKAQATLRLAENHLLPTKPLRAFYENVTVADNVSLRIFQGRGLIKSEMKDKEVKITQSRGSVEVTGLEDGEYVARLFAGMFPLAGTQDLPFYVGPKVRLNLSPQAHNHQYAEGASVTLSCSGQNPNKRHWLGIYRAGTTPGKMGEYSVHSYNIGTNQSCQHRFDNLQKGYYFANVFYDGGFTEVAERISFAVGEQITTVNTDFKSYYVGQDIMVSWKDAPGIVKDYIGVFKEGETADNGGVLVSFQYFEGKAQGRVKLAEPLPKGQYYLAIYTNDTYNMVSNKVAFEVR